MNRLLLSRAGTLLLSNGAGQAISFLTSIAISRLLDVDDFGEYATVMAWVFLLGIVADWGIEVPLTREAAASPLDRAVLGNALAAKALVGGLLALLLLLPPVAGLLAPTPASIPAMQLAGLLVLLGTFNAAYAAVFRAWGRMGYVLGINVVGLAVQGLGAVLVLIYLPGINALVAWLIVVQAGELLAGIILYQQHLKRATADSTINHVPAAPLRDQSGAYGTAARSIINHQSSLALLRRASPFLLMGLLGALAIRLDLLIIEWARGPAAAGVYSVATRLTDLLGMAPAAFLTALFPALAAARATEGPEAARALGRQATRRVALVGLAASLAGLLLAVPLVNLTFGPRYAEAADSLRVLALGVGLLLVNRTITIRLYVAGQERLVSRVLAFSVSLRLLLALGLVGWLGVPGVALANVAAELVVLVIYWLAASKAESE